MAYTTIDDPTIYFNTKLWTGDGNTTQAISGIGHQPDLVWIKNRNLSSGPNLFFDSVRGTNKALVANNNNAEASVSGYLNSFDSDGFTVGNDGAVNGSGDTYCSWNWSAGGSASSNSDGSITSTVSANTTAGFSIVKYTGTGANATVGHGLGVAPKMVIIKRLENATHWLVGGGNIGWTKNLYLSLTSASQTYNHFQDQSPSSSVVYMTNDGALNNSSEDYIMYCFAEKKGYSKFGSYTGNQDTNNAPFIYTGFKPAMIIVKNTTGNNWGIFDNKRSPHNVVEKLLLPNSNAAESTGNPRIDMLSNGFKPRTNDGLENPSAEVIYMAFAESPFVNSNGIPTTAR